MRWGVFTLLLTGCNLPTYHPVIIEPPTCYCVARPITCEGKFADPKGQKKTQAEEQNQLREEIGKAKQQVETMKGIVGKAVATPTPVE